MVINGVNLFLIISGSVLILDTIVILGVSNVNMGVLMPAIMGIPLLLIGLFYDEAGLWMSEGFGRWVRWILICGYTAFLLLIALCTGLIGREIRSEVPQDADAVIVLGAGVHGTTPSLALQNRLKLAAEYLRENENCIAVLSGGKGPQEAIAEAEAMYIYMTEEEGIPAERLIKESAAKKFSNVATRRETILGTNQFPNFTEKAGKKIKADAGACSEPLT